MKPPIILASKSSIRQSLLVSALVEFTSEDAKIEETIVKESMLAEGYLHSDIAIELADQKAKKISTEHPEALVIGCDQILSFGGSIFSKPKSKTDAIKQLKQLRNNVHSLISSVVVFNNGQRIWHHFGKVTLTMIDFSDDYLQDYVDRNWDSVQYSVGGYKIEEEGIRLFSKIDGSYFDILGLPLLELLAYLRLRGDIET